MRIRIVTPAPPRSPSGNRITALRWARLLRQLGHDVAVSTEYRRARCDLLVVLHARRGYSSVRRFHRLRPEVPLVVALTGTDLYRDLPHNPRARRSLELADRIVVLQPLAVERLPPDLRGKVRVIRQSAVAPRVAAVGRNDGFDVCVIGHLRPVKDPFRAAMAVRRLPDGSRLRVLHIGRALTPAMAARARAEEARNPRYRWLGERSHAESLRLLARSRLMVLTSRCEGGANVLSEAIVAGVPVIASRIDGSVGLLGEGYPGYFPPGDTRALRERLLRAERDPAFYASLRAWCERLRPAFAPERERAAWASLLAELVPSAP